MPAAEFDGDRVRLHEGVSEQRVEALARHLAEVGAVSSPIALGYRADPRAGRVAAPGLCGAADGGVRPRRTALCTPCGGSTTQGSERN